MTTAVDTNVWIALLNEHDALAAAARAALDSARQMGTLVAPAPVFAELMAWPGRTESFLDEFFSGTTNCSRSIGVFTVRRFRV